MTVERSTRDETLARSITWFSGAWCILFAVCVLFLGNIVTSKQWMYLMQLQGGVWTWFFGFGLFGSAILIGHKLKKHTLSSWGCGLAGVACFLVAAFYLVAPLIEDGLITLGMLPWFFPAVILGGMSAVNASDKKW